MMAMACLTGAPRRQFKKPLCRGSYLVDAQRQATMGDYIDDDDLIGMDEDFDEEPPPEMFGGGASGGPSANGAGAGTSGGPMEEFDEDYLAMIEEDMANGAGGGDGGAAPSGQQEYQQEYGESGFAQDRASASTGFDGPPRVIVTDPLKNEQESAAAREKRLYGFERYV